MTTLSISDMSCAHCKQTVEAALVAVPGSGTVTIDLPGRLAHVSGPAPVQALIAALEMVGYPATLAG